MVVVSVGVVLVAVVSAGLVAVSAGLVCVEEIDVSAAVVLLKPLVVDEVTVDSADSDVVASSLAVLITLVAVMSLGAENVASKVVAVVFLKSVFDVLDTFFKHAAP